MKNSMLNKISLFFQGRPLILHYQTRQGSSLIPPYIEVVSSAELENFDLKGLTPEIFCMNIADMVNLRNKFSGVVENEKQQIVARWSINAEELQTSLQQLKHSLSHVQLVRLLESLPGYAGESDNTYIDFEERLYMKTLNQQDVYSGFRLTIMTEEITGVFSSQASYILDTYCDMKWTGIPPAQLEHDGIRQSINDKITMFNQLGIKFAQVHDMTDYR